MNAKDARGYPSVDAMAHWIAQKRSEDAYGAAYSETIRALERRAVANRAGERMVAVSACCGAPIHQRHWIRKIAPLPYICEGCEETCNLKDTEEPVEPEVEQAS